MNLKENIQNFWREFELSSPELLQALKEKDYVSLNEVLQPLNELCHRISGAHLFVEDNFESPEVTLDSGPNKTIQLICHEMKKLAPAQIKKVWLINAELPPLSQKAVEAQIQIKDQYYTLADFVCFYTIDQANQSFICNIYCPGFSLIENPEHKREMCIYLMELAVGQTYLEAYISKVDYLDEPKQDSDFIVLLDFVEIVEEAIDRYHWKEYKNPLDIHSAYQPHQDIVNDALRKDMKLIHTIHPALVEENLAGVRDTLLDLKEKGGEFGYIYYSNPYENEQNAILRQELAKTINQLLAPIHCARVIGGSIGRSYSYIDLIVFSKKEFQAAFGQIQNQLKDKIQLHYRLFEED